MKLLTLLFIILILIPLVSAGVIEIEVKMKLNGKINFFSLERKNNVIRAISEFYNSGSVPYKVRARLDVLKNGELIFTGWSEEKDLMPGERKDFEIYWISLEEGNFESRIRFYFGNEIAEENKSFRIDYVKAPKDVFLIKNFRCYEDYLRFEIRANQSLDNVIVTVSDYMHGWVFEQVKLNLTENRNKEVKIRFYPTVWRESLVKINVFTEDGSYYSSSNFYLKKEKGLLKYLHMLYDKLSLIFNL